MTFIRRHIMGWRTEVHIGLQKTHIWSHVMDSADKWHSATLPYLFPGRGFDKPDAHGCSPLIICNRRL